MSNTEFSNLPGASDHSSDSSESDFMKFLRLMNPDSAPDIEDEDDDDGTEEDGMDADDYHNAAVDHARHNKYKRAVQTCIKGLGSFPQNVDLLADTIKYSCHAGDLKTAAEYYDRLVKIPRNRWNWRAYTFSFDYLIQDAGANEKECRDIIADYKRYLPHEEKAFMSQSELEGALGNNESSMNVLVEALNQLSNAPQCALRLADMQMERGMYGDVIKTVDYGLSASCETQPSINIPYLLLIRTLAEDALLHQHKAAGEVVTAEEVNSLLKEYATLNDEFPEMIRYGRVIKIREKCLKFLQLSM